MKLVYIEWIDGRHGQSAWKYLQDMDTDCCILKSVGWVLKETGTSIQIVPHMGIDTEQGCGDMAIPKKCVLKKIELNIDDQSK